MNNPQTNASNTDAEGATQAQEAVGKLLFDTRQSQGLDVADVARVLRISQKYLEAIEEGRNSDLPGTAYAIGFVRSYAEHLNLDGAEIVRRYKDEDKALGDKTQLSFPKPIPEGGVPGAAVLGFGAVIALMAYGAWYYNSNSDDVVVARVDPVPEHMVATEKVKESPKAFVKIDTPKPVVEKTVVEPIETISEKIAVAAPEKTVEKIVEKVVEPVKSVDGAGVETPKVETPVVDKAAVETVKPKVVEGAKGAKVAKVAKAASAPIEDTPVKTPPTKITATLTPPSETPPSETTSSEPAVDLGPSRVTVRALANSWIQIRDRAANRLLFTRLLRVGDEYKVPYREGLYLMTGNAGALELLVDGKIVPSIGGVGDVRRNVEMDPEKLKSGSAVTH